MSAQSAVLVPQGDSICELVQRLGQLAGDSAAADREMAENDRARLLDLVEAIRSKLSRKADRDPRSLFELDERLTELMDRIEDAASEGQELPTDLVQEVNDYLEAFQSKVDRIAGYLRWQESIAAICGAEAERLSARKKAAEGRVNRLKNMLLHFMLSREFKKLEGERAAIGLQPNSAVSLVIDDPLQIGECFFERSIGFTKTELQELLYQLPAGELRSRLEAQIAAEGWQINGSAVRAAITNGVQVKGARLVKGHHIRIR